MNFQQFFEALSDAQIDYVLVGGLAVSIQGVVRGTMDVDIVLAMDDANVGRFVSMAKRVGLKPSMPVSIEALTQPSQLEQWHREKGMIAFALRESAAAGLVVDASIAHLIELKTGTGRSIDAFDIAQLSSLIERGKT